MNNINFYDFAKNYLTINDGINSRKFNDSELNKLRQTQTMIDSGYNLQLIHNRRGDEFVWYKIS